MRAPSLRTSCSRVANALVGSASRIVAPTAASSRRKSSCTASIRGSKRVTSLVSTRICSAIGATSYCCLVLCSVAPNSSKSRRSACAISSARSRGTSLATSVANVRSCCSSGASPPVIGIAFLISARNSFRSTRRASATSSARSVGPAIWCCNELISSAIGVSPGGAGSMLRPGAVLLPGTGRWSSRLAAGRREPSRGLSAGRCFWPPAASFPFAIARESSPSKR